MKRGIYSKVNSNENIGEIFIYGEIGYNNSYWNEGTNNTANAFISELKSLGNVGRINIHLNSLGGDVFEGLAIYNAIKASDKEIHTYNDGIVASMAGLIFLAGITHYPKAAIFHAHSASTFTAGNARQHEEAVKMLNTVDNVLSEIITAKSGKDNIKEQLFDGNDHWLDLNASKELGLVDHVEDYEKKPPVKVTENANYNSVFASTHQKGFISQFISGITNSFSNTNNQKPPVKMRKLILIASIFHTVLALSEAEETESGGVVIPRDKFDAIGQKLAELKNAQDQVVTKDAEIAALKAKLEEKETKIAGLEKKAAAAAGTSGASDDNAGKDTGYYFDMAFNQKRKV